MHWSRESTAKAMGLLWNTMGRICREHDLKPHPIRIFRVCNDQRMAEKVEYLNCFHLHPLGHANIPCGDERSQPQALVALPPLRQGDGRLIPTHDCPAMTET
jgi:hypothetical protein